MKRNRVLFLLLSISPAVISQSYTIQAAPQLALAVDNHWYLESGQQLVSLKPSLSQIIFSPLFSLFLYLQNHLSSQSSSLPSHLFFVFLPTLLYSWGVWCLLFSLIYYLEIPKPANAIIYVLVLSNPYLIKYSSPLFSDSFSLIAGFLFTRHFGSAFISYPQLPLGPMRFFRSRSLYYIIMLILCLFRYLNVILLVASLITECLPSFLRFCSQASLPRAVVKALLVCLLILISFASVQAFTYFFQEPSSPLVGGLLQIGKIPQALLMSVVLNLGFREGFRAALYQPGLLFDYDSLSASFSASSYSFSLHDYIGSVIYAFAFLTGAIIAFISIYRIDNTYSKAFSVASLLLILCELFLGVSHHRYFLMLVPSVIYGLGMSLKSKELGGTRL